MNMINRSTAWKGAGFVFLSALMYASLSIFGKIAFEAGLSPTGALFLRFAFSLLILSLYMGIYKHEKVFQLTLICVIQGVFLTLGSIFYFYSLKYLPANITGVVFFAYPVVVALLSIPVYKENLRPRLVLALVLAVTGIILVSNPGQDLNLFSGTGILFALLSCLFYSFYCLISQKNASSDPISVTATISLVAVIILSALSGSQLSFLMHLSLNQILIGLAMAVINTVLGFWFFLKGLRILGASRAALVSTAEPPLIVLLAFLVLRETPGLVQVIGSLLVFASMLLSVKSRNTYQTSDLHE